MLSAVLDSTILVSAFLRKRGLAAQLLDSGVNGAFDFWFTPGIVDETCHVLRTREHLRLNFPYTNQEVEEYQTLLLSLARSVSALPAVKVCRDPNDDYVIATALGAGVQYIVTYDKDLLDLTNYQDVRMIRPEAFIHLVRQQAHGP